MAFSWQGEEGYPNEININDDEEYDDCNYGDLPELVSAFTQERDEQQGLLRVQGKVSPDWAFTPVNKKFKLVDTLADAKAAVKMFTKANKFIAFDTEGVNLSRRGRLTVVTLSHLAAGSTAYIFDILSIGRGMFLGDNNLKDLLESTVIRKISFDCRTDSDALYHQYHVRLANCYDLQVAQLGVKINNRSYMPGQKVRGIRFICGGYLTQKQNDLLFSATPPHRLDGLVWGAARPLPLSTWEYAANDVHAISALYNCMAHLVPTLDVVLRVVAGSDRYACVFRDAAEAVTDMPWEEREDVVMKVAPI
jgi:hypothetical protein